MAQVKFYLDKRKDKDGQPVETNVPIFLFYSFNGQRLKYFTGEHVDAKNYVTDYWKTGKEPVKKTAPKADLINRNLQSLRLHVETAHSDAKALGVVPDVEYFRQKLNDKLKGGPEDKQITFQEALELFVIFTERNKAYNTYKTVNSTANHLKAFIGKRPLLFAQVDPKWAASFRNYLINAGHLNNTVQKYMNKLRTFLKWCKEPEQGYFPDFNFRIKIAENDTDIIFLDNEQVIHLYNYDLKSPAHGRIRDAFVFGCFTGMRYGDLKKLKKTEVEENQLRFRIQKGQETVFHTIPLAPIAKEILARYKDLPGEKALPVISNQRMNDALKLICKEAGFDNIINIAEKQGNGKIEEKQYPLYELIGCHTCRKSFITIAMRRGMQEAVIKSISGHSKNSRAFTRYYHIVDGHKQEEMNRIFGEK